MDVRIKRLVSPLVFQVPHANRLVVRSTQEVFTVWMEDKLTNPVVVADLRKATATAESDNRTVFISEEELGRDCAHFYFLTYGNFYFLDNPIIISND